jgi:hypothetical protein
MDLTTDCLEALHQKVLILSAEYEHFHKVRLLPDAGKRSGRYEITEYPYIAQDVKKILEQVRAGGTPNAIDKSVDSLSVLPSDELASVLERGVVTFTSQEKVQFTQRLLSLACSITTKKILLLAASCVGAYFAMDQTAGGSAIEQSGKYFQGVFQQVNEKVRETLWRPVANTSLDNYQKLVSKASGPAAKALVYNTKEAELLGVFSGGIQTNLAWALGIDGSRFPDAGNHEVLKTQKQKLDNLAAQSSQPKAEFSTKLLEVLLDSDQNLNPTFKNVSLNTSELKESVRTVYNTTDLVPRQRSAEDIEADTVANRLIFKHVLQGTYNDSVIDSMLGQPSANILKRITENEKKFSASLVSDYDSFAQVSMPLKKWSLFNAPATILSLLRGSLGDPKYSDSEWAVQAGDTFRSGEDAGHLLHDALGKHRPDMRNQQIHELATASRKMQQADESRQLAIFYMRLLEIAWHRIDKLNNPIENELKKYTAQLLRFVHIANQESLFALTNIPMSLPQEAMNALGYHYLGEEDLDPYRLRANLTTADKELVHQCIGTVSLYDYTLWDPDLVNRFDTIITAGVGTYLFGGIGAGLAAFQTAIGEMKTRVYRYYQEQKRFAFGQFSDKDWMNGEILPIVKNEKFNFNTVPLNVAEKPQHNALAPFNQPFQK